MPEPTTELLARAERALGERFRGELLSRGAARALVWRGGALPPEGAPSFSPLLSQDLVRYGFGMLGLGLELRERGDRSETCYRAFEAASRALEAVLVNGSPDLGDRPFYSTVAAAAAHIGRFSARAASLLAKIPSRGTEAELPVFLALKRLMLRRLDELRELCFTEISNPDAWNHWAIQGLETQTITSEDVASSFLNRSILQAVAEYATGLQTGDTACFERSIGRLREAEALSLQFNHPIYWWVAKLSRHLLDDLWNLSSSQSTASCSGRGFPSLAAMARSVHQPPCRPSLGRDRTLAISTRPC